MTTKALGRGLAELGLDAILNEVDTSQSLGQLALDEIDVDPAQPRRVFDVDSLNELAQSIRAHGVLQPVLVIQKGERYQLVAGERRWRAAQQAGLRQIPAIVGQFTQQQKQAIALVENIQREDLTAIEQARAIKTLMDEHQLTHQGLSEILGFSRSQVTNLLRLLQVDACVQDALLAKKIQMGHARALIGCDSAVQQMLLDKITSQDWSVRQTEFAVTKLQQPTRQRRVATSTPVAFQKQHCEFKVNHAAKKKTITISTRDGDTWQALISLMETWCDK